MARYGCDACVASCCGVREIGNFEDSPPSWSCEFTADSFHELLERVTDDAQSGQVFTIWFVKRKDYSGVFANEFEWNELREIVQQIPGVKQLHNGINPNSNNEIDGYLWVNP